MIFDTVNARFDGVESKLAEVHTDMTALRGDNAELHRKISNGIQTEVHAIKTQVALLKAERDRKTKLTAAWATAVIGALVSGGFGITLWLVGQWQNSSSLERDGMRRVLDQIQYSQIKHDKAEERAAIPTPREYPVK